MVEPPQKVTAGIDFARELTFHELEVVLKMRCRSGKKTAEEFLVGMYPKKLIPVLLSLAEIEPLTLADQIPDAKITALAEVIKEFPPEKTLDMIAKVWEVAGILVDEKR